MTGRPSKYQPEYHLKAAFKLALLGLTDIEMAKYFEITESTISKWKLDYPEFSEALKKGKEDADVKVVKSLYKRAIGYKFDEQHYEGGVLKKTIVKLMPPDTTAQIFWLKNRQGSRWRDKQQVEHSGNVDLNFTREVVKTNWSKEQDNRPNEDKPL